MKAVPEFAYASLLDSLGKEAADEVVRFTLANVEELLKVTTELSSELQHFSEVRKVESLNVFTDEGALAEFRELLDVFEEHHPKRGRLVDKVELEEVSVIMPQSLVRRLTSVSLEISSIQRSRSISRHSWRWMAISTDNRHFQRAAS